MNHRPVIRVLLALTFTVLVVLGIRAMLPGAPPPRPAPVAFLALLTVELTLLNYAMSAAPRVAKAARLGMTAVPLVVAIGARIYVAFSTRDVLEWDETYYVSVAVTAADGRGLYPYIFGYSPMTILGSNGYAAYAYALAVKIAGPTVLALRTVSVLASLAGLTAMYFLIRSLYGTAAAWMGAALTSTLALFVMSNTVRMDTIAFAAVAIGLLAFMNAFNRPARFQAHLGAGLLFGLALQAHIDTIVTAAACGGAYVHMWWRQARQEKRYRPPASMVAFGLGYAIGAAVFVCFNILPDVDTFMRTTARVRVDASAWYSPGTTSLLGSFLDPRILLEKEANRYGLLLAVLPRIELIATLAALVALVMRRTNADRLVLTLVAGVLAATAIVLNTASPLYFIHVMPALIIPMAVLCAHGIERVSRIDLTDVGFRPLLAFAVLISALCAVNNIRSARGRVPETHAADDAFAQRVRAAANPACVVAGDGGMYVKYFADYPFFISHRQAEVSYAMLFFDLRNESEYWRLKEPGVVFSRGPLSPGLTEYVTARGLAAVSPGLWIDKDRCGR